ncbi:hypothetical protein WA026_021532 [Henosepilachna vigintioctopunctata]|uniref:Uncharacterized protein n=1 Tax=Henosepilachna vigintioctopunctata TaxID=420089 RepID=A0AAW1VJB0_9CUCU
MRKIKARVQEISKLMAVENILFFEANTIIKGNTYNTNNSTEFPNLQIPNNNEPMSKVVEVSERRSALRPKNQLLYSSVVSQNISLNRKENKRKNSFNNGYDKNAHQSQLLNKVNSDFRPYGILMSRVL